MIKNIIFFLILFNVITANASTNKEIANNFEKINTLKFKFTQKIDNNKIEKGECIILYPKKIWLKIEKTIMALPSLDKSSRMLQRLMVGYASELVLDNHNRILVPIELREFSGIKKSAMFIGQGQRFEIWNYQSWNQSRDSWLKKSDLTLTEQLRDISI